LHDRLKRLERLGVPLGELSSILDVRESAINRWVSGTMSLEEADIFEVGLLLLELRLARAAMQHQATQRIVA
jgi:hypothetical protein